MNSLFRHVVLILLGGQGVLPVVLAQTPVPVISVTTTRPAPPGHSAPLTLDRVLARFFERNLAVEAARHRLERTRADEIAARLRPNPSVLLTAENFKVQGSSPFTVPFNRLYEVGPTYSQSIELGRKRRLRMEVAALGVSQAEAEFADVLRLRLTEVKRAFYEAVLARQLLELVSEQRRYYDDLVDFNQARLEEGAISGSELLKVKLERVKSLAAVSQAQLAQRQAGIRLLELLGESNLESPPAVAGEIMVAPIVTDLEGLRQRALSGRPDLEASGRGVTLAQRRLALEKARGIPDITPFAGFKRVGVDNTIQFGVTIPLLTKNRNQAEVARAAADQRVAETEAALLRNRVLAEVESAYRAYETALAQVGLFQRELLEQADKSLDMARFAYREGATDLLPLLESQRTRTEIRQQYLRTLYDYQASLLLLEAAIGGEINP